MKLQAPSWFVYQPVWVTSDTYPLAIAILLSFFFLAGLTIWMSYDRSRTARFVLGSLFSVAIIWLVASGLRHAVHASWMDYDMPISLAQQGRLIDQVMASDHPPTLNNVAPYLTLRPFLSGQDIDLYTWDGEASLAAEQLLWISAVASVRIHSLIDTPESFPGRYHFEILTQGPVMPVYWTDHHPHNTSGSISIVDMKHALWVCRGCE